MKSNLVKAFFLPVILFLSIVAVGGQTNPPRAVLDMTGEGKTDLHLVARVTNGSNVRTYWCWRPTGNQTTLTGCSDYGLGFFSGTTTVLGADFENDSDTEYIFYRQASSSYQSNFWALGASPFTPINIAFGLSSDDATVTGDYSGDGKADFAIFRCNPSDPVGTQCYWIYRNSEIGTHVWIPWGTVYAQGKADIPVPGDFDGDGKHDAAVRRPLNPNDPNSQNIVYIRRSSDGAAEYHSFGISTDKFVKGDFDGDGKTDLCAVRNTQTEGAQLYWFIRYSSTGNSAWFIPFGLGKSGDIGDYLAPGDYTGDGRTDIAVWRRTAANEITVFYILPSTPSPGAFGAVQYERISPCSVGPCEYPVAQYQVH